MIIKRYFSENIFEQHVKNDFGFLIDKIIQSGFEYDLQIRDNYFNLYYKGNSIGKVSYNTRTNLYKITIHNKFINQKIEAKFIPKKEGAYLAFTLTKGQLHPLFSSKNLLSMAQKVKEIYYQEETTFEQMIMTDNINRQDLIIIDRQIVDEKHKAKMDLLALAQKSNNYYQFCVIEVKLGNNPELRGYVATQIRGYIKQITENFSDYKNCYEKNFEQKQDLGLLGKNLKIDIIPGIQHLVVVLGYSGIAKESIKELKKKDPEINVLHLKNIIDLLKTI